MTFVEAFVRIWDGNAENDGFNGLVLAAGLDWRQVALLRGYCKYLLQTGAPFSQSYVEATFAQYPLLARVLVELFDARFNPTIDDAPKRCMDNQPQRRVQLTALADGDTAVLKVLEPMLEASFSDRHVYRDTVHAVLLKLMDRVANVDEDRILRSFVGVIDATLRTNYYQTGKQGPLGSCISFKFDSTQIQDLPKPHPYREIFVYSPV